MKPIPNLTLPRWLALRALADVSKPFLAQEVKIKGQTIRSLERAGWVQRADPPKSDRPFTTISKGSFWQVTDAGRAAIASLPETQPRGR